MRFNKRPIFLTGVKQLFTTGNINQKELQGRMLGLPPLPCPLRLKEVIGLEGRTNDIVYCPPKLSDPATSAVIFFGGDVQIVDVHWTHRMCCGRDVLLITNPQKVPVFAARMSVDGVFSVFSCLFYSDLQSQFLTKVK